jgi:hypothetical protein
MQQRHTRFFWCPVRLEFVTFLAAGHKICPCVLASSGPWHNMIQGQLRGMKDYSAVLAGIPVPQENVLPAQNLDSDRNMSVLL